MVNWYFRTPILNIFVSNRWWVEQDDVGGSFSLVSVTSGTSLVRKQLIAWGQFLAPVMRIIRFTPPARPPPFYQNYFILRNKSERQDNIKRVQEISDRGKFWQHRLLVDAVIELFKFKVQVNNHCLQGLTDRKVS